MVAPPRREPPAPFRSIVVATDFTIGARDALERAAQLPLARGARVSLLHVFPRKLADRRALATLQRRVDDAARRFAARAESAGHSELEVTGVLAKGQPFVEILRQARRRKADLIVVGRHGRRVFRDLVMGSTAQRMVRQSEIPVLVVHGDPQGPWRRPVVATDLGPTSRHLGEIAARILDPVRAQVQVVHAFEVPFEGWVALSDRSGGGNWRRLYRQAASPKLARFAAALTARGLRVRTRLIHGDPRKAVLGEARRTRADLLVVGTHGRSGVSRALLGTVAEGLVSDATCDVLIARPPGVSIRLP